MKKLMLLIFMCMILSSLTFVSAAQDSLGTYKQGETILLLQICGTCTYNNITSIVFPNSSHLQLDAQMVKRGMEYTYEFNKTHLVGTYLVNGHGDLDGTDNAWAYEFEVTSTGQEFTIETSVFYIGVMFILLVLFILCLLLRANLPNEDPKDFEGKLIDINWLKYLRMPVLGIAWGLLTMILFLGWNLAEAYLGTALVAKIFEVLFRFNFYAMMIAIPIMLLYLFVKAIEDKKFQRMIQRGLM